MFRAYRRCGWSLPLGPDGSVREELLLPDGHGLFESIDREAAGIKCGGAMGSADGDKHAGFADFESAEAVSYRNAVDIEPFVNLVADLLHLCQRHRFIRLVLQVQRPPARGLVAHEAVETYDGSILPCADVPQQGSVINGLVHQFEAIVGGKMVHREGYP